VQQIIRAYEDYDVAHPQRGGNAGAGAVNSKTGAGSEETAKIPNRENQRA